ncbi:hypothetical protein D3C71_2222110 [compost metagenome]
MVASMVRITTTPKLTAPGPAITCDIPGKFAMAVIRITTNTSSMDHCPMNSTNS